MYKGKQESYQKKMRRLLPPPAPDMPWLEWRVVSAEFRLWGLRDPLELPACLKWPVDVLIEDMWVLDDGPKYLKSIGPMSQRICRAERGVTLEIERIR